MSHCSVTKVDDLLLCCKNWSASREFDKFLESINMFLAEETTENVEALTLKELNSYAINACYELDMYTECIDYCDNILEMYADDDTTLLYKAKCLQLLGKVSDAVQCYITALHVNALNNQAMEALINGRLLSTKALNQLINSLHLQRESQLLHYSYKTKLDNVCDLQIEDHILCQLLLEEQLSYLAKRAYYENNLEASQQFLEQLTELMPENIEYACMYLTVLVEMRDVNKLFVQANRFSCSNKNTVLALYSIGCFYYVLSSYDRASRYFARAIEMDASVAYAWVALGHCYYKLEENSKALNVYRQLLARCPGMTKCNVYIGMQYARLEQKSISLQFYEQAIQYDEKDVFAMNELAVMHSQANRHHEALKILEKAYDILHHNTCHLTEYDDCILYNLATVLRKLHKYNEAIHCYKMYLRCRPNASHAHVALAFTYHLCGKLPDAIRSYNDALSLKNDLFSQEMLNRALIAQFYFNTYNVSQHRFSAISNNIYERPAQTTHISIASAIEAVKYQY